MKTKHNTSATAVFTRFFLSIAVPAIIVAVAVFMVSWRYFTDAEYELMQSQAQDRVFFYQTQISQEMASAISDFHYLLNSGGTRKFSANTDRELNEELDAEYIHFLNSKVNFFQVRMIGLDGREILRFEKKQGGVYAARGDELQDKSDRYYFTRALTLKPSQYYISALDLNIENGEFTRPLQPTLRFVAPLFDEGGKKRAVFVVNYDASSLMQYYAMNRKEGSLGIGLMVDEQGNWLRGIEPKDAWAHILGHGRSFANRFPQVWQTISASKSGIVRTQDGIFSFNHIAPNENPQAVAAIKQDVEIVFQDEANVGQWVLMHFIAPQEIAESLAPLKSAGTKVLGFLVLIILVGSSSLSYLNLKRRESAAQVKKVQKGLVNAQRLSSMGSWAWDVSGENITWSENVYRIYGLQDDAFQPTLEGFMSLVHPDDEEFVRSAFRYSLDTSRPLIVEHRIVKPDGMVRSVIQRGEIISDDHGTPISFEGIVQDITERKRFEKMLRMAKDEAEAATITKTHFLANMSHEIRTPMNGVVGMLELLRDTPLDATQKNYVTTALSSAAMQMSVINDILDFSKIESGHLELERVEFDIVTLIEDMCVMLAPQVSAKGVDLSCFITPKLKNLVMGDPMRLQQIIANLVGNAIKFTHEGEIAINCKIVSEDDVSLVLCLEVEDTGIGISESAQENLFVPFSQADSSTTRRFGGSGLGLAICRELVEIMGGSIHLKSEEGKGSLFWLEVKLEKSSLMMDEHQDLLSGKKVMVVDGNVNTISKYEAYINDWGSDVVAMPTAKAALDCVAEGGGAPYFDLIIIDCHVPDMEGVTLAETLKSAYGDNAPPICLCSAVAPLDHGRLAAAGVRHTFMDPVRRSEIKDSLLALSDEGAGGVRLGGGDGSGDIVRQYNAKILVVEDTFVNQQVIRGMLKASGITIDIANNGREGVEKYKSGHYDLIFMDVQMPEMDGYQATLAIREHEKETGRHQPIVAMTAHAMAGDREKCLDAGMDDYLSKPVKRKAIDAKLYEWLSNKVVHSTANTKPIAAVQAHHNDTPVSQSSEARDGENYRGIDPKVFDELRVNLSSVPGGLREVVEDYKVTANEQVASIKAGFEANDLAVVFHAAHSLKSNSASLGAMGLSHVARDIEIKGRNGDMEGLDLLIGAAEELWVAVESDISKLDVEA